MLDKSIFVDDSNSSSEQEKIYKYYIKAAQMINYHTIQLRDLSNEIMAYIPEDKNKYKSEMKGLLKKTPVAKMFKTYLIEWLNNSGHYIRLYCSFTQDGMVYDIDHSAPQKSIIIEPHTTLGEIGANIFGYNYEDTAVTDAFVYLGILKHKKSQFRRVVE